MKFERVLMIWGVYDGPRTGIALHKGVPHYFRCEFDKQIDDYPETFELCPVSSEFLDIAEEQWGIFREWENKFHHGLVPLETHPGHRGTNPKYDDLDDWLRDAIGQLKSLPEKFVPRFEALPDQDYLPVGILRELKAAWIPINE